MHQCDLCKKEFTLMKNLNRHIRNIHNLTSISKKCITNNKEAKHRCTICQLAFVVRSSLRRHERLKHKFNITAPLRTKRKSIKCITFEPSNLEEYPLLKELVPVGYIYKVNCIQYFDDGLKSKFEIADCAKDIFFVWLSELEQKSRVTYRVKSFTKSSSSKIIFNKVYRCIHNTFPSKYRVPHPKHTGCMATLTVRIKKCSEALSVKNTKADNNVILIPYKAIVTLYHHHNHILGDTKKICFTEEKKLSEIPCNQNVMHHNKTENKLNFITHVDKFSSPKKNKTLSRSQVSIQNKKNKNSTKEVVNKQTISNKSENNKFVRDDDKKKKLIENNNFESPEKNDQYILVENENTQNALQNNNKSELNTLMSDYNTVNKKILQQFESNPTFFKSAVKHYTLAMKNNLTSKQSLLNALNSFGKQLKEDNK